MFIKQNFENKERKIRELITDETVIQEIIQKFKEHIVITHFIEDYILLPDLVAVFEKKYQPRVITNTILNYLRKEVNLMHEIPPIYDINKHKKDYQSIVIGRFNKRAYLGIRWKDEIKNQKYYNNFKHISKLSAYYKMGDLVDSPVRRINFIKNVHKALKLNKINWNYANSSFYNTVLLMEINYKLDRNNNDTLFSFFDSKDKIELEKVVDLDLLPYYPEEIILK